MNIKISKLSALAMAGICLSFPAFSQDQNYPDFGSMLSVDDGAPKQVNPGMSLPSETDILAAEEEDKKAEELLLKEAFDASMTGALPLSPEQIRTFLEKYDNSQRAVQTPVYEAPKPRVGLETVSLDPGATPLVVMTSVGYVSTLNFIDVTGEQWPIKDIGWAGDYEILQPEDSSHIIRITPLSEFGNGNISIRLVGLKTPIVLTLNNNRDEVDYRTDLRIPELGPKATTPPIIEPISTVAGSKDMTSILVGVLPQSSESLVVSGVDSRTSAYSLDGSTYVRTPYTLLSPGWSSSVKSSDGTTVYKIGEAPVILLSNNGRITRAYLKKKEKIDGM